MDFIKYKTDLLLKEAQGDPIKLSRLINSIVHTVSVIPDDITRSVYIKETAMMLGMEERALVAAVAKEIVKAKEEQQKQRDNEQNRRAMQARTGQESPNPAVQENPAMTSFPPPAAEDIPPLSAEDISALPPVDADIPDAPPPPEEEKSETINYIPAFGAENMLFYRKELLLVQVLVRYGERILCYTENEAHEEVPVSVTEFIHYALQEDGLFFHNPLHKRTCRKRGNIYMKKGLPPSVIS